MNAMSHTHAHAHFGKIMDQVCQDHVPLIITRKNNQAVVMISLEDYQAMEETNYLRSFPYTSNKALDIKNRDEIDPGDSHSRQVTVTKALEKVTVTCLE